MNQELLMVILQSLAISILITVIVVVGLVYKPWKLLFGKEDLSQRNRNKIVGIYRDIAVRLYDVLEQIVGIRLFAINMASTFRYMYILNDYDAKVRAASVMLIEIGIGVVTFILGLMYFNDTFITTITTIMVLMYAHAKIKGDGRKFLVGLDDAVSDLVHMYNAGNKNIDRMFKMVLSDRNAVTYRYLDQMYDYVKRAMLSSDSNYIVDEYNSIVPSRHLRIIFNYLFLTYRYGDEINENGESMFNRNMLAIQREIHADIMKVNRIKDATIGEQVFIIMAVLVIPMAQWYMNTFFTFEGFETIYVFLNSSIGYAVKIICAVFALIMYYIYNAIVKSNMALENYQKVSWEELLVNKSNTIRKIVNTLMPASGTKRRIKLETDIATVEGYAGIRGFYVRKIIIAALITSFVVIFTSIDTFTIYRGVMSDLYIGVNKDLMDTVANIDEFPERYKSESLANDILVIDILKDNKEEYFSLPASEKVGYIEGVILDNGINYGLYYDLAAKRISEKFNLLNKLEIKYIFLIAFIAFIAAYMLPNLALIVSIKLNQGAIIYDEVIGYYTIVVLLVNHSASNVHMLIYWLNNFARVFKSRFQTCADNLNDKEIKELSKSVEYKPFNRLVECILLAYKGASLKAAFAGIEQRHMFQEESRRLINEEIIVRRIAYSRTLSWLALGVTFTFYIVCPMMIAIVEMALQLV